MRKMIASCSAAMIMALVLAACGSSGSSKPAAGTTNTTTTTASGSSNDAFSKLLADASKQRFKITYNSGGTDTHTYEQDGNGNSVYGSGDSQLFTTASGSVSCNKNSDGTSECTSVPSVGAATNPFLSLFNVGKTYLSALGGRYGHTSSKTIAGRDAQCVSFSAADVAGKLGGAAAGALGTSLKGSASYCIDKATGVLLEITGTDDTGKASTSLSVTKFEEPSDSDFTPPATPKTIPSVSLPAGVTLPPGVTIPGGG